MAILKNTNDLITQAATDLPDNSTQRISPQDVRQAIENVAFSSFNKVTDSPLVGLKAYNTLVTYESGQGSVNGGKIYISNQITGPGAFNAAHWDLYEDLSAANKTKIDFLTVTQAVDLDALETSVTNNNAKVTNSTHTGDVSGSDALTIEPTAISGKPNLVTPSGTEKVLVEDGGVLKHVLISALAGGTDLGNILYVSTTGSNTETRANALGNLRKPLTPEQARSVALSGDTIVVMSGSYTLTLTTTNGYAKDGVNWVFMPKAIFNKTTTGAMFSTSGFSIGCNVFGDGEFYGTGSCGKIYADGMSTTNYTFEGNYCENTASSCHETLSVNSGIHNIRFKHGVRSTASYGILPSGGTAYIDCPEIVSTVTNAVYLYQCQKIFINGNRVENTTGGVGLRTSSIGESNIALNYCNYANIQSALSINYNVNQTDRLDYDGISNVGILTHQGKIDLYKHISGNAKLGRVSKTISSPSAKGDISLTYRPPQSLIFDTTETLNVEMYCENTTGSGTIDCAAANCKITIKGIVPFNLFAFITYGKVINEGTMYFTSFNTYLTYKYLFYVNNVAAKFINRGIIDCSAITDTAFTPFFYLGNGKFIQERGKVIFNNINQSLAIAQAAQNLYVEFLATNYSTNLLGTNVTNALAGDSVIITNTNITE